MNARLYVVCETTHLKLVKPGELAKQVKTDENVNNVRYTLLRLAIFHGHTRSTCDDDFLTFILDILRVA